MPLFKNLFNYAQQFVVDGVIHVLHSKEVKELPESFIGRFGGLIEPVVEKVVVVREKVVEKAAPVLVDIATKAVENKVEDVTGVDLSDVVDEVELAVQNANKEIKKTGIVAETEQIVNAQKAVKNAKKGK